MGTAIARGGAGVSRGSGVSEGFATPFFFFGVGDFSGLAVFFFFFPLGDGALVDDFLGVGLALASGVSLGVADSSESFDGVFFFLGFGEGVGDFAFLWAELFGLAVGGGGSSSEFTACALRMGVVLSSVCSA